MNGLALMKPAGYHAAFIEVVAFQQAEISVKPFFFFTAYGADTAPCDISPFARIAVKKLFDCCRLHLLIVKKRFYSSILRKSSEKIISISLLKLFLLAEISSFIRSIGKFTLINGRILHNLLF